MGAWKRIGIAVKSGQQDAARPLRRILALLREQGVEYALEPEAAALAGPPLPGSGAAEAGSRAEMLARCDLVIALGGDGTVLGVAREIGARATPILGINVGHLGFLTEENPDDVERVLAAVLAGHCRIEERARLEVILPPREGAARRELVLNDAVFTKGTVLARMIELEVRVDDQPVATYRSDGLIVATPTGSTAYNLSAGGPLLHPTLSAMMLTPICPHTLTQRPLVLPDDLRIEVKLVSSEPVAVTLDGQVGAPLEPRELVRIARAAHPARFVTLASRSHFETLRTKLGWGAR